MLLLEASSSLKVADTVIGCSVRTTDGNNDGGTTLRADTSFAALDVYAALFARPGTSLFKAGIDT